MVQAHHPDPAARAGACTRAGSQTAGWNTLHHQWVRRAELSICKQAVSILGHLGKAPKKWASGGRGLPALNIKTWFQKLKKHLSYFVSFKTQTTIYTKFFMIWYGSLLPSPVTAPKSKLQQAPDATNCYFCFHTEHFFFFFYFLRKQCQSLHLVFRLRMSEVHHH